MSLAEAFRSAAYANRHRHPQLYRLTTLGAVDLRDPDGAAVEPLLAQPKRLALLVYLAGLPPGTTCRRDTLLALFWPESDRARARASLRRTLHFIRQSLAGDVLQTRAEDVGLAPDALGSDLQEFQAARAIGDRHAMADLHAGEFLPGFHVDSAPGFEEWAAARRVQLRAASLEAAESLARESLAGGNPPGAVRWARRAVEIDPEEERVVRLLMEAQAASGDRAAGLETYQALESRLASRHGDTPSAMTEARRRQLVESDEAPRAPPPGQRRRIILPVWIAAAAVLAAVVLAGLRRRADTPDGEIRIAVLPFSVSSPAGHAYLETGFPVLLSARLHGVGPLRSIDPGAAQDAWERTDAGRRDAEVAVGRAMGASLAIRGSVAGTGDSLRITAVLWDVEEGAAVGRSQVVGTERELHTVADRVAARLLGDYLTDHGDAWAATAARTTTSPAAMKAWLEGEAYLRQGRYEPAVRAFQAATRADSTFAMGQYRLALAADWAGQGALVNPAVRRAAALRDRLGPQERTLVEALLAAREGTSVDAERLYRQAATSRPSDVEAWLGLGETLFHRNPAAGRSIGEARPAFDQVLRLDPGNFAALTHLARLAAVSGDVALLDRLTREALRSDPDGGHRSEMLLLRAVSLGDRAAAASVSTLPVDPATLDALWRTADYASNPAKVQAQARLLLRGTASPEMRASLHLLLAHLAAAQGCGAGTAEHADSLGTVAPATAEMTRALFRLPPHGFVLPSRPGVAPSGLHVYTGAMQPDGPSPFGEILAAAGAIRAGDEGPARQLLALDPGSGRGISPQARAYLVATLGARGSLPTALEALARADTLAELHYVQSSPLFPRALSHLAASQLLRTAGRADEALARLEGHPEDLGFGVAYRAALHHRRAALLRASGDARQAAREEAAMRRLWRGCPR